MTAIEGLRYPQIRRYLNQPWAIWEPKLAEIEDFIALKMAGVDLTADEIRARIGAAQSSPAPSGGGVAVIPIYGTLARRLNLMTEFSGGTSTEQLGQQLDAAMSDPNVSAIVFDIDSPGGVVDGIPELADRIASYRGQKPMIAQANTLMASAAYWLGSQANEVVVSPSAMTGSIGVIAMHVDESAALEAQGIKPTLITAGKYKARGNPYEPLSEDDRSAIQQSVDDFYAMFANAVARGRGVSVSDVRDGMGQGDLLNADAAIRSGLADRKATLQDTIARLSSPQRRARVKAEEEPIDMRANGFATDARMRRARFRGNVSRKEIH